MRVFSLASLIFIGFSLSACKPGMDTGNGSTDQGSLDLGSESFNVFQDVGYAVGRDVDHYYNAGSELLLLRNQSSAHASDFCDGNLKSQERFSERISYAVLQNMVARKGQLSFLSSEYSLPSQQENFVPVSLMSHAMCSVTADTLTTTLGSSRVPSAIVIQQANEFARRYNSIRAKILGGDRGARFEMTQFWARTMMCLSYTESLTTADTSLSSRVARDYAPSDFRKPAGVLFYEDPDQGASSRLNVGLFQFSPVSGGNIYPCLKQWNELYPSCPMATNSSTGEMIRVLGSSYQTFNAFCGANKPVQMFSEQVNTLKAKNTHPFNLKSNGSLKAAADRCVSLHFTPGTSYTHFGPFLNSTQNNLQELLSCALAD